LFFPVVSNLLDVLFGIKHFIPGVTEDALPLFVESFVFEVLEELRVRLVRLVLNLQVRTLKHLVNQLVILFLVLLNLH